MALARLKLVYSVYKKGVEVLQLNVVRVRTSGKFRMNSQ